MPTLIDWNLYKRDIEQLYKTGRAEEYRDMVERGKGCLM